MSEANLLTAAKSGESASLESLYLRHSAHLYRTAFRITRNREDAEDAVQDSLLSAFLHLESFDERSTFGTWLTRIAINCSLMILRRKRTGGRLRAEDDSLDEIPWEAPDCGPNPEHRYAETERRDLLSQALANLRPSLSRPLRLYALQECSMRQVATETGLSVAATKGRIFHARTALRRSKILRAMKRRAPKEFVGARPAAAVELRAF